MKAMTLFLALFVSAPLWASEVDLQLATPNPLIHIVNRTYENRQIIAPWFQVDALVTNTTNEDLLLTSFEVAVVSPEGEHYQVRIPLGSFGQGVTLPWGKSLLLDPVFVEGLPVTSQSVENDLSYKVWLMLQGRRAVSIEHTLVRLSFQTR